MATDDPTTILPIDETPSEIIHEGFFYKLDDYQWGICVETRQQPSHRAIVRCRKRGGEQKLMHVDSVIGTLPNGWLCTFISEEELGWAEIGDHPDDGLDDFRWDQ